MTAPAEPRIRGNDHGTLTPPELGAWQPRLTASVVVPAHGGQEALDLTLAALAGQSYPAHLTEVVVVDDGSAPAIRLPELRPENTRLIPSAAGGWGRSHAVRSGSEAAEGDVVVWIDADTIAFREHLEAQLRWHHLARYLVVLGSRRAVDFMPGDLTAEEVHTAVRDGAEDRLYRQEASRPNHWIDTVLKATDDLRQAGPSVGTALVGSTASAHRDLLRAAGDSDPKLILGEDSELGYRLSQAGGVFIPERAAKSWHLGAPTIDRDQRRLLGFIRPHLTDRIPTMRPGRAARRQWLVPYVDVVVDTADATHDAVRATADAVLDGSLPDVQLTLVGPWSTLTDGRRKVLADPLADLRLIHAEYAHEGRVRFVEQAPETSFPAPFRLHITPGWRLAPEGLAQLVREADTDGLGLIELGEGAARLERTAAVRRALFLKTEDDDLDALIAEVSGSVRADAAPYAAPSAPDDEPVSVAGLLTMLEEQGMRSPSR